MKMALGFLLASGIGAACRIAGVPLPAPPVLIGALLVAMSTGYVLTDRVARSRAHYSSWHDARVHGHGHDDRSLI